MNPPTGPTFLGIDLSGLGQNVGALALVGIVGYLIFAPRGAEQLSGFGERKRPIGKQARAAIKRAERRGEDDLADRIAAGQIRGDELRRLMASGKLQRKNLDIPADGALRRNPTTLLERAKELSRRFHEGAENEVIHLAPEDRVLSEHQVFLGYIPELRYEPDDHSGKRDAVYVHKSGDRGEGKRASNEKPCLVIDPRTHRANIVYLRSPMKLDTGDPHRGLVG